VGAEHGPLATNILKGEAARFVMVPNFTFTGFQPDMVYLHHRDGAMAGSPVGAYHSRIIIAGFLMRLGPKRIKWLFNSYIFQLFGYFDEFPKAQEYFDGAAAANGFSLRSKDLMANGHFMHTINHSHVHVGKVVSREAAILAGATPVDPIDDLEDEMALDTVWPFYPELATRAGLPAGSNDFLRPAHWTHLERRISLEQMIEESLATYNHYENDLNFEPFMPAAEQLRSVIKRTYS
jgi:hypothetical protein